MATFWRKGHYRNGTWVEGHWVTRNDFSKISYGYSNFQNYSYALETHKSFTIPNIRCKCCGDEIFFYQSPYGGKVFFNELGHPWEKHCCEPECCAKKIENIPYKILDKYRIIESPKEPLWEKEGWIPSISIREENISNSSLRKVIFKSMEDYEEYTFFILVNSFFPSEIEEGLAINFRPIDETFFEISFYLDDIDRKYIVIASKYSNCNDLEEFIIISDSLDLIKKKNVKNIELVKIFFKILNISNEYKNEKEQLNDFIVNHKNSKESEMSDIYNYINRFGLQEFEENFSNSFKDYNKKIIDIFSSTSIKNISTLNNIHKIILEKKQDKINIKNSKKKKNNTNLRQKKSKWKGISVYKSKKLIFVEKDNNL